MPEATRNPPEDLRRYVTWRDLLIALTSVGTTLAGLVIGSWISLNQEIDTKADRGDASDRWTGSQMAEYRRAQEFNDQQQWQRCTETRDRVDRIIETMHRYGITLMKDGKHGKDD